MSKGAVTSIVDGTGIEFYVFIVGVLLLGNVSGNEKSYCPGNSKLRVPGAENCVISADGLTRTASSCHI